MKTIFALAFILSFSTSSLVLASEGYTDADFKGENWTSVVVKTTNANTNNDVFGYVHEDFSGCENWPLDKD